MTSKFFVTSIGKAEKYEEATYRLNAAQWRTRFAPVAVGRLLALTGSRAVVLVTREARARWYEPLAQELRDSGMIPEPLEIPTAGNEKEILSILAKLIGRIDAGSRVVLDVTFSLRHLPFVYLASLAYLTALGKGQVEGIYYGALELKEPETNAAPIIDLTPLLVLMGWYHGLRSFRESGDAGALSAHLAALVGGRFRHGERPVALARAKDAARRLADSLAAGLPLETGFHAAALRAAVRETSGEADPATRPALDALVETVTPWACEGPKQDLPLCPDELNRQLRLAEWYAERGRLPSAIAIVREWVVSSLILGSGQTGDWLDYGRRRHAAEQMLNALDYRSRRGLADDSERNVASLWRSVADLRNKLMHCGMTTEPVTPDLRKVRTLIERCRTTGIESFRLPASPTCKLLVSPLGLSPGVLYSAVARTAPERVVVITSEQARENIGPALIKARRSDVQLLVRVVRDPHTGFAEARALLDDQLRQFLISAGEVVVNLTGGTTVMQYLCERVAGEVERLGVPVRRVALVDRRSAQEQGANPWVPGEMVELDEHREAAAED